MLRCHFCHFWLARVHTWGPALSVRRANNSSRILTNESIDVQMHFRTARLHTSGIGIIGCSPPGTYDPNKLIFSSCVCRGENLLRLLKCFFWPVIPKKNTFWNGTIRGQVQKYRIGMCKKWNGRHCTFLFRIYFSFSVYSVAPQGLHQ